MALISLSPSASSSRKRSCWRAVSAQVCLLLSFLSHVPDGSLHQLWSASPHPPPRPGRLLGRGIAPMGSATSAPPCQMGVAPIQGWSGLSSVLSVLSSLLSSLCLNSGKPPSANASMRVMTPFEKQQATELKGEYGLKIPPPLFSSLCAAQCLCLPNFL